MWTAVVEQGVCASGLSDKFEINVDLRLENALSPLLFIVVLELTSRTNGTKDILLKLLYADDRVVVAEGKKISKESVMCSLPILRRRILMAQRRLR